ncbi:hypothetical protein JCM5350_007885 [Sporobolomyces pararoseus]
MKERVKKVNYAEVDSDVDLDEEERELERMKQQQQHHLDQVNKNKGTKAGDTFGATNNNNSKKKKRKTHSSKSAGSKYNSKLLLDLPFDLFSEVCSHLEGKDLLALAKVNKTIRNILLSRGSRSIWSALRRKLGYPLPDGFNELGFALLEYSKICQICSSSVSSQELTVFLRKRFCYKCYLVQTISSKGLKSAWPDLHSAAVDCVRFIDRGLTWMGNSTATRYLTSDLQAVDAELKELEEQDELAASLLENQASKGSSTRSRRSNLNNQKVEENHVEKFIKERKEWVESEQQTSVNIVANRKRLEKLEKEAVEAREEDIRARRESLLQSLEDNHGWQHDEVDYLKRWNTIEKIAPKASIEEDPEAWSQCRRLVRNEVDEEARRLNQLQAQGARQELVTPYYDALRLREYDQRSVFPDSSDFLDFASIQPLWKPETAVINDEIWQQIKPDLKRDLEEYEEMCRVEAIRIILAANQGLSSTSSLSKNPADYPESIYDDNFFSRITSRFSAGFTRWRIVLKPFPEVTRQGYPFDIRNLEYRISSRQILIIRLLSKAAGLDPETASYSDFDRLGSAFVWVNDPRKSFRQRKVKRSFLKMFHHALRKGPSKRKIAQGETFEFEYRSALEDADDEGSQDSDDDEDEVEEEEEEDGEEDEGESEEGDGAVDSDSRDREEGGSEQEDQLEED